jgi:class I fructose-bisphosphate aldolase
MPTVSSILSHYRHEPMGVQTNLYRLLNHGALSGTGRLIIYPVDQGFEHGPRAFLKNTHAMDPVYHPTLAIEAGLSAYAAPLGWLEAGMSECVGKIPMILKINSSNQLAPSPADQALTASVDTAVRMGCIGIGFTMYPGSPCHLDQLRDLAVLCEEARQKGLLVIVWSYPRGDLDKKAEQALDVVSYGAHMAAQMGAHIIKVKLPKATIAGKHSKEDYDKANVFYDQLSDRVHHVVQSCFHGKRLVIFSGGEAKTTQDVLSDARAIKEGGGHGSIIGRNCFQRPREEALSLLKDMIALFKS